MTTYSSQNSPALSLTLQTNFTDRIIALLNKYILPKKLKYMYYLGQLTIVIRMLFCTQGLILPTTHQHLGCFTSLASHIMDSFVARRDFMMPYYQAKIYLVALNLCSKVKKK